MLASSGLSYDDLSIDSIPYEAMPGELARHHAGLFFLTEGLSEHGCSPTKTGEYWAMGLPIITTPNVSDADDIIRKERVGVIVKDHSDGAYLDAAIELDELLKDEGTRERCRRAAQLHYALEPACERQLKLYRRVISPVAEAAARAHV
jgi:glycosyltransferase involved in cell wall biosynthesis